MFLKNLKTLLLILFFINCSQNKTILKEKINSETKEIVKVENVFPEVDVSVKSIFLKPKVPDGVMFTSFLNSERERVRIFFKKKSESYGKPSRGRLFNGRFLQKEGNGFIHTGKGSYGTDETISCLIYSIGKVREKYPDSVAVVIGSLSKVNGGKIKPHKSHQNGRDVDIGYYYKGNKPLKHLQKMRAYEVDVEKTWTLIENLLQTGWVEYIFMNYKFQKLFYDYVKNLGYDEKTLKKIFQYPRGRKTGAGIIRHEHGHLAHFHVRFLCASSDKNCLNE